MLADLALQAVGMAWKIHTWSVEDRVGTIVSPHFGPIAFDARANEDNVDDFTLGEAVLVELEGSPPNFVVRRLLPMNQRQPAGTHWPPFDAINGRFGDARIEELSAHALQLWLGDCCDHCTPNPIRLQFEGVTTIDGLSEDLDTSNPLFRLASSSEIHGHRLVVPEGAKVFCMVTCHGEGRDGPSVLVVAREVRILEPTSQAGPSS
jgi:hypothetical protein